MVIVHCTLNKQTWMIPHFNQRVTADAKMYHTWLYVKCTKIYDHICTQFWRSVSPSGHYRSGGPGSNLAAASRFRLTTAGVICVMPAEGK